MRDAAEEIRSGEEARDVAAVVKEPEPFKKALNIARDAKCSDP